MRVTRKGQVTIPKPVRDRLGIRPGTQVEFTGGRRSWLSPSHRQAIDKAESIRAHARDCNRWPHHRRNHEADPRRGVMTLVDLLLAMPRGGEDFEHLPMRPREF
jgi:AbrB family looped-hinge helix DNA binding protein